MKKKDIITLVVGLVVIVFCGYLIYSLLSPGKTNNTQSKPSVDQSQDNFTYVKVQIDEDVLSRLEKLNDYGTPSLNGLGKTNLFSN